MTLPSSAPEPLHQHGRLRTDDVDLAQSVVSAVYEPHVLEPHGGGRLDARLNAVQNGSLTLGYLTYGVGAGITLPPSERWYHVNITLSAEAGWRGVTRCEVRPRRWRGRRCWSRTISDHRMGLGHRTVRPARAARGSGEPSRESHPDTYFRPCRFRSGGRSEFDGGSWIASLCRIHSIRMGGRGILTRYDNSRRHLESLTLTNLVMATGGPHRELLDRPLGQEVPDALQRAVDYVHDHARSLPTLADLTAVSGSSARTLQNQFLRHFDRTPIQYIRDVRLRGCVTTCCIRTRGCDRHRRRRFVGVLQPGPVLVAVSEVYGESPSETLRRCRS